MNARRFCAGAVVMAICLSMACSRDPKPRTADLRQALQDTRWVVNGVVGGTRSYWEFLRITEFAVEAMENQGTKVDPQWYARIRFEVTLTSPAYMFVEHLGPGVGLVRLWKQAGESVTLYGRTRSTLSSGTWRTSVEFDRGEFRDLRTHGLPLEWSTQRSIVQGSEEEATYRAAEQARQQEVQLAAEREAEGRRVEAEREAERRRVEAERQRLAEVRAAEDLQRRIRDLVGALESPDCSEGDQTAPSGSDLIFVVPAARECWTQWIAFDSVRYLQFEETGNILVQLRHQGGRIRDFEDGPTLRNDLGMAQSLRGVRFKSKGGESVTVRLRIDLPRLARMFE